MRVFSSIDEVAQAAHTEIGSSEWLVMDQERVNLFADATDDHQWIHVDIEKANAGPFGGPIAHGYLTLSLLPHFGSQIMSFETPGARLNYGLNKVRFPPPVRVGARIRAHLSVGEVVDLPTGKQVSLHYTIEIEGQAKPACVAETVVLLLP
jgi:acyl dehydratase